MKDNDAVLGGIVLSAELEAELAQLRQVLEHRGWREDSNYAWCWRWPTAPPDGIDLFRSGPLILFDDEDPSLGYLVESPLLHDQDAPILQYSTVTSLINALDRIETWTYPQQAAEIDPNHAIHPSDT